MSALPLPFLNNKSRGFGSTGSRKCSELSGSPSSLPGARAQRYLP